MTTTQTLLKIGLLGLFALLLGACGQLQQGATPLSRDAADRLGQVSLSGDDYLIAMLEGPSDLVPQGGSRPLPGPVAAVLTGAGADATTSCVTEFGTTDDADADGIPLDAYYRFDCEAEEDGAVGTVRGEITLQDKDDHDPDSGYRAEIAGFELSLTENGETETITLDQLFDLTVLEDRYDIIHSFDLSASGPEGSGRLQRDGTLSYEPDDVADPFAAGTFVFDGTFVFTENAESYTLYETSPGVHFDAACEDGFDDGVVRYEDSLGNQVEIRFDACGVVTVSYNGTAL